jgi:hypothetical protein
MDGTVLYTTSRKRRRPRRTSHPQEADDGNRTSRIIVKFRITSRRWRAAARPRNRRASRCQPAALVCARDARQRRRMSLFRHALDQVKAMADRIAQQPDVEFTQPVSR